MVNNESFPKRLEEFQDDDIIVEFSCGGVLKVARGILALISADTIELTPSTERPGVIVRVWNPNTSQFIQQNGSYDRVLIVDENICSIDRIFDLPL
ncbi:hypothetical protein GM661_00790 [Iocasia frigidifontis]|uniref:Uncharacterized protein n=1 Tax=Iocasia fonsfrigidae TaxID=2682810 RepID=A0A8A7K5L8_9FIRM|nr:hypothetical protein [Iocasia fonsfrigidae]QTL96611.1 hypothetical protein GM661_00790 [Iocasia fonsfrigidae]